MRWMLQVMQKGCSRINGLTIGFLGISWSVKKEAPQDLAPRPPSLIERPSAEQVQRITQDRFRYEAQRHTERELSRHLSRGLQPARSRTAPAVVCLVCAVLAVLAAAAVYFWFWR